MKNIKTPIVIALIVVLVGLFLVSKYSRNDTSDTNANINTNTTVNTNTNNNIPVKKVVKTTTPGQFTMIDVSTHNTESSCWTAINGSVYDVTAWISAHPGGKRSIIGLCGIDGSDAFNGKHGGQARPASELATFKIGILK